MQPVEFTAVCLEEFEIALQIVDFTEIIRIVPVIDTCLVLDDHQLFVHIEIRQQHKEYKPKEKYAEGNRYAYPSLQTKPVHHIPPQYSEVFAVIAVCRISTFRKSMVNSLGSMLNPFCR